MPRRFFRKFSLKRQEVGERWYLSPFQHLLHDRRLWGIRRQTVAPAFALGLFMSFMPFPGHPLFATLLALLFRINVPVAFATTFVSNPLTMGPVFYVAYQLGSRLLGMEPQPFEFEMSLEWMMTSFAQYWAPISLGCLLLGLTAGAIGYVVVDLLWRSSIWNYKADKRRRRRDSERNGGTRHRDDY
ncbi:MAG: DUF2062 domain-containing protein [Pseudomonadota bacterium]